MSANYNLKDNPQLLDQLRVRFGKRMRKVGHPYCDVMFKLDTGVITPVATINLKSGFVLGFNLPGQSALADLDCDCRRAIAFAEKGWFKRWIPVSP